MEGSPVRSQHRSRIAQLNQAQDLHGFQTELVRLLSAAIPDTEFFLAAVDGSADRPEVPSWLKPHLERHPALYKKLEQGELVGISNLAGSRSSVVLIPIISDTVLYGAIGALTTCDGTHPATDDIETIRQVALEAAPILSRIHKIERLRSDLRRLAQERATLNAMIQLRSHLHSNAAHELRTPLAAIRGYARMILDGRSGPITEIQRDYLRVITENTNRLINTVGWLSHVVDLSEQQFELTLFDLRDVWTDRIKFHETAFAEKSIRLAQHIPSDSLLIAGDKKKFACALDQLIAAAIRFTEAEGQIAVEFSRGRDRELTVKISATGTGMPAEVLGRIFDRSQEGFPAAPVEPDAGAVSLSGVHDVVGMHGGRMFVNSTSGKGCTFLFTLPAVKFDGEEKLA